MTRDTGDGGPNPLPAEAYPGPIMEYQLSDGVPVVHAVDGTFRAEFGAIDPGTPVVAGFDRVDINVDHDDDALAAKLAAGEQFEFKAKVHGTVATETQPSRDIRATVAPDTEGTAGHVVFRTDGTGRPADKADLGIAHVASVVSHDLRNPLEVAKTRLRAGRDTGDDKHFEHVARAHDRMERIIEDVLTLTRGEDTIDPSEEVDLTAIAETAWSSVDSAGATLTVDSQLPTAVVDPDRTERVFENLFRNAVEHGTTGEEAPVQHDADHPDTASTRSASTDAEGRAGVAPEIRIGAIDSAATSGFYVADDGPGIPADEREAVFKPGYSTHDHGTGLGLAIVDQIAEAHGWTLRITASKDGGAKVEVRDL